MLAGVFKSIESAVDSMVQIKKTFEPDMQKNTEYKKQYEKYKLLFKSLTGLFELDR